MLNKCSQAPAHDFGGPLVNIALAFVLVVGSLMFVGTPAVQNKAQLGSVESGSLAAISGPYCRRHYSYL